MRSRIGLVGAAAVAALIVVIGVPAREVLTAPVQAAEPGPRVITVHGEDEVRAAPDMARIHLGVQSQGATAEEAMRKNTEAMNAVVAAVKNAGIPDQDIQTTSLSLWPTHSHTPPYTIVGYQASNNVTVTVNDLGRLVWVLDGAVAAGANTSGGVHFAFKDDNGLKRRALVGASNVAKAKAEALAAAMGTTVVGLHSLNESGVSMPPYPIPYPASGPAVGAPGAMPAPRDEATKTPVQPGQMSISASVTAAFIIG